MLNEIQNKTGNFLFFTSSFFFFSPFKPLYLLIVPFVLHHYLTQSPHDICEIWMLTYWSDSWCRAPPTISVYIVSSSVLFCIFLSIDLWSNLFFVLMMVYWNQKVIMSTFFNIKFSPWMTLFFNISLHIVRLFSIIYFHI